MISVLSILALDGLRRNDGLFLLKSAVTYSFQNFDMKMMPFKVQKFKNKLIQKEKRKELLKAAPRRYSKIQIVTFCVDVV